MKSEIGIKRRLNRLLEEQLKARKKHHKLNVIKLNQRIRELEWMLEKS